MREPFSPVETDAEGADQVCVATVSGCDRLLELPRSRAVLCRVLAGDAVGAQLAVLLPGQQSVVMSAGLAGPAQPLDENTAIPLMCASKPLLSVLCLQLAAEQALDLDAPVTDFVAGSGRGHRDVVIRHLLTNTAGLAEPRARAHLADLHWRVAPDYTVGWDWKYSLTLNWLLLEQIVVQLLDMDLETALRQRVLGPLAVDCHFLTAQHSASGRHGARAGDILRYHVPTASGRDWLPPSFLVQGRKDAASRAASPLRTLVAWYAALLHSLHADDGLLPPDVLRSAITLAPRSERYGTGFMVGMRDHLAGRHCSARSFGHLAGLGDANLIAAYAEPADGVVLAMMVNNVAESSVYDLSAMGTAVYEDLGLCRTGS